MSTFSSEPYHVPDGFLDAPFIYVYDGTGLTNGTNTQNVPLILQGDAPFILRRISGIPRIVDSPTNGGKFAYQNAKGQYAMGNASTGIIFPANWPVLPEKTYPIGASITMDFYQIAKATAEGVLFSYAGFAGVKRFPIGQFPWYETKYNYREKYHVYNYYLTLNWAAGTAPQTFYQVIDSHDFELLRITVTQTSGFSASIPDEFQVTLYHANGRAMSNIPVTQTFLSAASGNIFPVPPVVYPNGASLQFDVNSLVPAPRLPKTYIISFEGVWRIPV